jgi:putative transposase
MRYRDHRYRHGIGWTIFHMQWVTKYRYRVFNDQKLKNLCTILLHESAKRHRFELEEVEVQPDHVHVLAKLRPSLSPSRAINLMKGYTSRLLFMLEESMLRKFYKPNSRERSLWSDGKFIGSVGHITLEKAKEYLQRQEAHHAEFLENPHPLGLGRIKYRCPSRVIFDADIA